MPHRITLQPPRQNFARGPSQAGTSPHIASLHTSFTTSKEARGVARDLIRVFQPQHRWRLEPDDVLLCVWEEVCPVYCRIFSNIPGLSSLDHSTHPRQMWQPKISPDMTKCALRGKSCPPLGATGLDVSVQLVWRSWLQQVTQGTHQKWRNVSCHPSTYTPVNLPMCLSLHLPAPAALPSLKVPALRSHPGLPASKWSQLQNDSAATQIHLLKASVSSPSLI